MGANKEASDRNNNTADISRSLPVADGVEGRQLNTFVNCGNGSGIEGSDQKVTKRFNMSGYAASRLERVRVGFIGLGNRGPKAVLRMSMIDGVDIKGLCD